MRPGEEYQSTEVFTATPQKLQLMLIEAALRSGQRAQALWTGERTAEVSAAIIRCQSIVAQLLAGVAPNVQDPLVGKVAAVYSFIFRSLVRSHSQRDPKLLADALSVLEIERETWRQVCEHLGGTRFDAPHAAGPMPHAPADQPAATAGDAYSSVSFEA